MYIRDLKNTKGHISGLTGGEWNPKSKETILTSSEDGSIRLWDVSDFKSQKQVQKILGISESLNALLSVLFGTNSCLKFNHLLFCMI